MAENSTITRESPQDRRGIAWKLIDPGEHGRALIRDAISRVLCAEAGQPVCPWLDHQGVPCAECERRSTDFLAAIEGNAVLCLWSSKGPDPRRPAGWREGDIDGQAAAIVDLKRENAELRAYLKAFCTATIDPEDRGRDVSAHEANPFIEYEFVLCDEDAPSADRTITGGQVRRAMELVGFDKLKIQPADKTISEELTEVRDLRHEVKTLQQRVRDLSAALSPFAAILADGEPVGPIPRGLLDSKLTRADLKRATALLAAERETAGEV